MYKLLYMKVDDEDAKYKHEVVVPFVMNEIGTGRHSVTLCMTLDEMQCLYDELELALEEARRKS